MTKPNFAGNYVLYKSEKMDEYLAAVGVPWIARKFAARSYPTLEITQNDDEFTSKLISLMFTFDIKFKVGTEFEETQPNGVVMKVLPRWDDDKLVMDYRPKNPGEAKEMKATREMINDEVVLTLEIDNIVAKRYFKRVK